MGKNLAIILIFLSLILFFLNLYDIDFKNLKENNYSSIASNILVLISMVLYLKNKKKI